MIGSKPNTYEFNFQSCAQASYHWLKLSGDEKFAHLDVDCFISVYPICPGYNISELRVQEIENYGLYT